MSIFLNVSDLVQGGYIPVQGGYIPVQGGYIPVQGGYIPVQGGYIPVLYIEGTSNVKSFGSFLGQSYTCLTCNWGRIEPPVHWTYSLCHQAHRLNVAGVFK